MSRSMKKPVHTSKTKPTQTAPKKVLLPQPAPKKKSPPQKILTAEGWKRLMLKSSSKKIK